MPIQRQIQETHFYMKVFGKTYSERMAESEFDKSQRESVN